MAIVSHHKQFIFVHLPKTGGTAVNRVLQKETESMHQKALRKLKNLPFWLWPGYNGAGFITPRISKHAKAREIRDVLGDDMWETYFTFTFVRNPWDLMVSSYKWWLQKAYIWPHLKRRIDVIKGLSFPQFIRTEFGMKMINEHYGDMYDWLVDEEGRVIVDHVGKYEHLQEEFTMIGQKIGLKRFKLPQVNITHRDHYRAYYDDATRELVARRFIKTIEAFDYKF
jgi:hypothetical protein